MKINGHPIEVRRLQWWTVVITVSVPEYCNVSHPDWTFPSRARRTQG